MNWQELTANLSFPEGPRWHDGRLWFSDFYTHRVLALGMDGALEEIVRVPGQPSGLGWTPDGDLLIVSMTDRKLLRWSGGALSEHADLGGVATFHCNDMVVDRHGRAYVGNFGFNSHGGEAQRPAKLARVEPDGQVFAESAELLFPNGTVITDDGKTLIIGESQGGRLSAFDVAEDGSLTNHRLWADIAPNVPDGICLDAEGGVWSADPRNHEVIRVEEGGEVTARLSTGDEGAYACMLGGPERRTLFACVNSGSGPDAEKRREGRIVCCEVDVPGAGWPGNEG